MPVESWLYLIIIYMIFASIVALELTDLLSAIISVGMAGLGLTIAFLLLQAPDLALVQFVFEIISVIILLQATGERWEKEKESWSLSTLKFIFLALSLVVSAPLFLSLPPFGQPLMLTASRYLSEGVKETGAVNLVASIILDYRAYDTLGEAIVIFVSVLGVATLLRKIGKGRG